MKNNRVTIKDLARELNISTSTVSRALRNHPEIKDSTRQAVLELAEKLDYQPNLISLSLLQQRTNTIGVVVPKMGYHFFSEALEGIEDVAIEAGYTVMVCQTGESYEREVRNVQNLAAGRVDGLLVSVSSQTKDFAHFVQLLKRDIPLVFFDRECEELETFKVVVDNEDAAIKVVDHLVDEDCKKIAYLGGPATLALSNTRLKGYKVALQKHALETRPEWITHTLFNIESAREATAKLLALPNPPDAILAMSDRLATAAILEIRQRGLHIPKDIAVVGFNNEPADELITPALTSVILPEYEIGQLAMRLLLKELNNTNGKTLKRETVELRTELVIRDSSRKRTFS